MNIQSLFAQCRRKILAGEYSREFGPAVEILWELGLSEKAARLLLQLDQLAKRTPIAAREACLTQLGIEYGLEPPTVPETPEEEEETDDLPIVEEVQDVPPELPDFPDPPPRGEAVS